MKQLITAVIIALTATSATAGVSDKEFKERGCTIKKTWYGLTVMSCEISKKEYQDKNHRQAVIEQALKELKKGN